ncbi:MAG: hypothetical protein JXQ72_09955 [Anaerolineae bacterium]|nr:hypothetical protein [Anaerolineae bacterium]
MSAGQKTPEGEPDTNGADTNQKKSVDSRTDRLLQLGSLIVVVALVVVVAWIIVDSVIYNLHDTKTNVQIVLRSTKGEDPVTIERAQEALEAAERATGSAERVLSFLEAAGFLIALALGASALYGIRNSRETRDEWQEMRDELKEELAKIEYYRKQLDSLDETLDAQQKMRHEIQETSVNAAELLQVYQEFNRKKYLTAYDQVQRLLEIEEKKDDPAQRNPHTLYIGGWLEVLHITGKLDAGIEHLEQAMQARPGWPYAKAAYGVALRRKGQQHKLKETDRQTYWRQAEQKLHAVLIEHNDLMEPNQESFWATLGGLRRSMGNVPTAIEAYEEARKVTPYSSYPTGNLAQLYLRQASEGNHPDRIDKAVKMFERTEALARSELQAAPGDYYHTMDIAMSIMMLGATDDRFEDAHDFVDQAVSVEQVTPKMLDTSLSGWRDLLTYCPGDWPGVRENLKIAIATIKLAAARIAIETQNENEHPGRITEALQALQAVTGLQHQPANKIVSNWRDGWQVLRAICLPDHPDYLDDINAAVNLLPDNNPTSPNDDSPPAEQEV